jgi:hypothetical protein
MVRRTRVFLANPKRLVRAQYRASKMGSIIFVMVRPDVSGCTLQLTGDGPGRQAIALRPSTLEDNQKTEARVRLVVSIENLYEWELAEIFCRTRLNRLQRLISE